MEGIIYIDNFIENASELFTQLSTEVKWDESMIARKTASYGIPYNYSQITYVHQAFPPSLEVILDKLEAILGFKPNNCLLNYYANGKSKMGFHSDRIDNLVENTGIAIISLGESRILRFRNIENKENLVDFELKAGSLVFMTIALQKEWKHAIPKSDTERGRISLTFRKLLVSD